MILILCPAVFDAPNEHEQTMRELLDDFDRRGLDIARESRGNWLNGPDRVATICRELNPTHTVDLLRDDSTYTTVLGDAQRHGLNEGRDDYDCDFPWKELEDTGERTSRPKRGM